jgi:hypothetical protein
MKRVLEFVNTKWLDSHLLKTLSMFDLCYDKLGIKVFHFGHVNEFGYIVPCWAY